MKYKITKQLDEKGKATFGVFLSHKTTIVGPYIEADFADEPTQEQAAAVYVVAEVVKDFECRIEQRIFDVARTWRYGSARRGYEDAVDSLVGYANSKNAQYRADAAAFLAFRDKNWEVGNALMNQFGEQVSAGGDLPTWEDIKAQLPAIPEKPEVAA